MLTVNHETTYYPHEPVLLKESVSQVITDSDGIYIDATLGGGGHSLEFLSRLSSKSTLIGLDQDDQALSAAKFRIGEDKRFTAVKGNFGYLKRLIPPKYHNKTNGILFDLGMSTHQINAEERGFSYQKEGPLDMRMGNLHGTTAYEVINTYSYEKLRDIIYHYGEERLTRPIARAITNSRPVETTMELRKIIESVVQGPNNIKSIARVFQAVRIEVNDELSMLRSALEQSLELLKVKGRIAAISYHSLEDRIVKRFFKAGNHTGVAEKDFYGHEVSPIRPLTGNIIRPTNEEIGHNQAARSAKLRIAEKIKEV